ncbi:hypothetical protein NW752_011633 [Fusarium irregulare]|uniref:DUF7708 domain-containing protein n=1 Tax=Fusarium irregulare TaxID=2494466 RepID=A0A9W8PDI6_9HYPO|nr:hypothetical protein NW766_012510 [Fusarium irregulare]KAJ4004536.1 hypothetical protein NW752_011633 [Fusarium irregulare]
MQDHQRAAFLAACDRHPPNQAITYMENNVAVPGQPLPIFSERANGFVTLNEARLQQSESNARWNEVRGEMEDLFKLMEQVQKKLDRDTAGNDAETKINLRKCDWKAVMGEVARTAQQWKSRPNKQGKVMVFIDKIGRHSGALETWLGILPMGDYGSSICGVFKIVIGAAGQYTKVEEGVYEALSEIPRIMDSAKRYVGLYRQMREQSVEQRTIELFRAILTFLRRVMQYFLDDKSKKFMGTLMKQGTYKEQLFTSLDAVKACAQAVNEEAWQCQARMVSRVYENTEKIQADTQRLQAVFNHFLNGLLNNPRFQKASPDLAVLESSTIRPDTSPYDLLNVDFSSLQDKETSDSTTPTMPTLSSRHTGLPGSSTTGSEPNRLLQCLYYHEEFLSEDIDSILSSSYMLNENAKSRVASMLRNEKFQAFMTETRSSTSLLVNGRGDLSTADGISPFSVVVAEMAPAGLTAGIPIFVLKYFCSEHNPSRVRNRWSSPTGMLSDLIGQLVCQMLDKGIPIDLSFVSHSKWRKLDSLDVRTICSVFKRIVQQLPQGGVVLCVIDEISVYERQSLVYETDIVMSKLVQLVRRNGGPVFKLLVTCYVRALEVDRLFPGCTLDLEEDIEVDDSAGWTMSHYL